MYTITFNPHNSLPLLDTLNISIDEKLRLEDKKSPIKAINLLSNRDRPLAQVFLTNFCV